MANPADGSINKNVKLSPGFSKQAGERYLSYVDKVFVPEIWTSMLLADLEENLLLASATFTNRQFEGEFKTPGDMLRVPHFLDTVSDKGLVKAYGEIGERDHAALEYIRMTCQKGSSFHLEIDSVHQLQTQGGIALMSNLISQRARQLAIQMDRLVAKTILAGATLTDGLGLDLNTVESITDTPTEKLHGGIDSVTQEQGQDAYDLLIDMIAVLDENYAPEDRYLFISPAMRAHLLRNEKFIDASHWGGSAVMPTGAIGQILGLPVYVSSILGKGASKAADKKAKQGLVKAAYRDFTSVDMVMGSTNAVSVVVPYAEMAAYKPEKTFTDAIKSRVFYDAKIIRPEQVVVMKGFDEAKVEKPTKPAEESSPAKK